MSAYVKQREIKVYAHIAAQAADMLPSVLLWPGPTRAKRPPTDRGLSSRSVGGLLTVSPTAHLMSIWTSS